MTRQGIFEKGELLLERMKSTRRQGITKTARTAVDRKPTRPFCSPNAAAIRILLGLNLARQPTFALVLLGDLYLQDSLRLQRHRALYSRLAARRPVAAAGTGPD